MRPAVVIIEKDVTASTNDDARALALEGAPAGTAVLARRQSRGRGRAGRAFVSPEGGLYLSVILRPTLPAERWGILPLAVAAEASAILRARGFPVDVKWPNDLLLSGSKLGGILVESRLGPSGFLVAGLGLNLEVAPTPEATCLAAHGEPPPPRELADALVRGLVRRAEDLAREGPHPTLAELSARCVTLGRKVEWEKGEGVAVGIAEDGALVVVDAQGARQLVVAGDVRVRQSLP